MPSSINTADHCKAEARFKQKEQKSYHLNQLKEATSFDTDGNHEHTSDSICSSQYIYFPICQQQLFPLMVKTRSWGSFNGPELATSASCGGGREGKLSVFYFETLSTLLFTSKKLKSAQLFGSCFTYVLEQTYLKY